MGSMSPENLPDIEVTDHDEARHGDDKPCSSNMVDEFNEEMLMMGLNGRFVKTSTPVPGVKLELRGREVVFAILLFMFVSIAVGMSYVIASGRLSHNRTTAELQNATQELTQCRNNQKRRPDDVLCLSENCLQVGRDLFIATVLCQCYEP